MRCIVVLTPEEVRLVLREMRGVTRLAGLLLYGSGMRLMECLTLRVKDVDIARGEIRVRRGKGARDRVTELADVLRGAARLGRFLGNLTLDELPVLWNVRRDLSLVGPRPPKPQEVDPIDRDWREILEAKPGLFSVSVLAYTDRYNDIAVYERRQPDLRHAREASWALDLTVLVRSLLLLLRVGHLKGPVGRQSKRGGA